MTRTHAHPTLLATGLAALLSAALIAVVPSYAAQSAAAASSTSAEQTAAKQLAEQLSEAYSRVSIVRNGDVVTLNDPNRSQDSGTSTRQHRQRHHSPHGPYLAERGHHTA
ncbi:hypothetical protein [uncultured Bifidobacterium sp.]|uniref:hypothetical protein n=1 Tax=uncultured Bifidobacterium sp. TaxID=165187 RepID=UPI002586EDAC|nr:hypothetical protein [uncultured Bifidobacterium sp.]